MSINEINAEAKESLRKYFKNSQDVKHENEARKELEGMQKELKENTKHQMEYVNSLKQNTMNARA